MPTIFDTLQRKILINRLSMLGVDTKPLWGNLTARNLLQHLTDLFKIALGELEATPIKSFFSTSIGKWLAIYVIPWPKSPLSHPSLDITKGGRHGINFITDMSELKAAIERFVTNKDIIRFFAHPVLGEISNKSWGYIMNKHLEHHLKQFNL